VAETGAFTNKYIKIAKLRYLKISMAMDNFMAGEIIRQG
jgi:hypothetical protein